MSAPSNAVRLRSNHSPEELHHSRGKWSHNFVAMKRRTVGRKRSSNRETNRLSGRLPRQYVVQCRMHVGICYLRHRLSTEIGPREGSVGQRYRPSSKRQPSELLRWVARTGRHRRCDASSRWSMRQNSSCERAGFDWTHTLPHRDIATDTVESRPSAVCIHSRVYTLCVPSSWHGGLHVIIGVLGHWEVPEDTNELSCLWLASKIPFRCLTLYTTLYLGVFIINRFPMGK
jgi:hypothetical protein